MVVVPEGGRDYAVAILEQHWRKLVLLAIIGPLGTVEAARREGPAAQFLAVSAVALTFLVVGLMIYTTEPPTAEDEEGGGAGGVDLEEGRRPCDGCGRERAVASLEQIGGEYYSDPEATYFCDDCVTEPDAA